MYLLEMPASYVCMGHGKTYQLISGFNVLVGSVAKSESRSTDMEDRIEVWSEGDKDQV
jgi:hypothetical protein